MSLKNFSDEYLGNLNHALRSPLSRLKISLMSLRVQLKNNHNKILEMEKQTDNALSRIDLLWLFLKVKSQKLSYSYEFLFAEDLIELISSTYSEKVSVKAAPTKRIEILADRKILEKGLNLCFETLLYQYDNVSLQTKSENRKFKLNLTGSNPAIKTIDKDVEAENILKLAVAEEIFKAHAGVLKKKDHENETSIDITIGRKPKMPQENL